MQIQTSSATQPQLTLAQIRNFVKEDFAALDQQILANLHSDIELIQQVGHYLIESGGKRLRPLLTILVARAFGYNGSDHVKLATIIEFIHTATLLHDDVVDASDLRRGRKTANSVWGNEASVLVGDFLYSRTFQLMASLENLEVMRIMADTTNTIAEGEVLQLINRNDPATSDARYMDVIRRKTAVLFAAAAQLGAVIANRSQLEQQALSTYGLHLGLAFQLIDDVLDYTSSAETLGKNVGDDLAEGKPTLPLIYALQHARPAEAEVIKKAITEGGLQDLEQILGIIEATDAFSHVRKLAQKQATQAKAAIMNLSGSEYSDALMTLAELAVTRQS